MKVLLITNDFPPMGGGVSVWYGRMCATVPPDQVMVLAPHIPGDRRLDAAQAYQVIRRRVPTSPHPMARLTQVLLLLVHAIPIVRRQRVQHVHIGHLHLGPVAIALRLLFNTPYVIYLHGGELAPYMRFRAVRALARSVVGGAHTVVANSTYTLRHFEALGIHNPRVKVLTMSVETQRFHPDLDTRRIRDKYGLNGSRIILTVGRLVPRKGHDVVIRAINRVRQSVGTIRYLIAGRGPEEERLRALARTLGCSEHILFLGHVPDDELPCLYAACDVFVMPSRFLPQRDGIEGFGIVFLEAGACGRPVIGGRSGGVTESVIDGVTGLLVDPTSEDELANALIHLLTDQAEAARLGIQGRHRSEALESAWSEALRSLWDDTEDESPDAS